MFPCSQWAGWLLSFSLLVVLSFRRAGSVGGRAVLGAAFCKDLGVRALNTKSTFLQPG